VALAAPPPKQRFAELIDRHDACYGLSRIGAIRGPTTSCVPGRVELACRCHEGQAEGRLRSGTSSRLGLYFASALQPTYVSPSKYLPHKFP
jgi:hypothetical protein